MNRCFRFSRACSAHPGQRMGHPFGAVSGARCVPRVPLGRAPSLHRVPRRLRDFVRRLLQVLRVRLTSRARASPASCPWTSRCALLGLARSRGRGISRFPYEVSPRVRGVFDRAGPQGISRWRPACGLPPVSRRRQGTGGSLYFAARCTCLHVPLSTLHARPRGRPRMTRGRGGSLRLL